MPENAAVDTRNQHRSFWENFFLNVMPRLFAYALRLVNGRTYDAEDLVNETFCRILMYPRNPNEIGSHIAYLKTVMRHIWSTKWRKEGTARTESLDDLLRKQHGGVELTVEPDALRTLENDELRDKLRVEQGPLTPREKELLRMYLEGRSCEEMGGILGEDPHLIGVKLNAVRTKVRRRLMKRNRSN